MELIFKDKKIQFDPQPDAEHVIEQINEWIGDTYYMSHFIADGIDVYENPEHYMRDNVTTIGKLEVVARTSREFLNDILLSAEQYLNGAVPEITKLTDGFYNAPSAKHWTDLGDLLEGMQWVNQVIATISQMTDKPANWEQYTAVTTNLEGELVNMNAAMENGDHVLIADIIHYELLPQYTALQQAIGKTIGTEGNRHHAD